MKSEERRNRIGGSDIGAIIGFGFKTPMELWEEKCGIEDGDDLPNLPMKCGIALESTIIDEYEIAQFARLTRSVKLRGDVDWIAGEADAVSYDKDGRVEFGIDAKFTRVGEYADGQVPPNYAAQGQWYMSMCGAQYWDFAVLHATMTEKVLIYRLARDEEAIAFLRSEAEKFWECVQTRTPPHPVSAREVEKYFAYTHQERKEVVEVDDDVAGKLREIATLRDIENEAKEHSKKLKVEVAMSVGNSKVLVDVNGNKLAVMAQNGSLRVF